MDGRARRGREIQGEISKILYEHWNPLGFADVPSDEYDSYVGSVYRILASGASCERVAEHLVELERALGLSEATAARTMAAAKKLCELDVRL